jgi:hypothetical protein
MKIFFLISLNFIGNICIGQPVTLYNTWMEGSKAVYIGVENKLVLHGNVKSITSIQSDKGWLERNGDTLIVKPTSPGVFGIVINIKDQSISYELNASYLPIVSLVIANDSAEQRDITKEDILASGNLRLASKTSGGSPFVDYDVMESFFKINNQTYRSTGNALSSEAKQVIQQLQSGSIIQAEQITIRGKSTGKILKLGLNQSFTIK